MDLAARAFFADTPLGHALDAFLFPSGGGGGGRRGSLFKEPPHPHEPFTSASDGPWHAADCATQRAPLALRTRLMAAYTHRTATRIMVSHAAHAALEELRRVHAQASLLSSESSVLERDEPFAQVATHSVGDADLLVLYFIKSGGSGVDEPARSALRKLLPAQMPYETEVHLALRALRAQLYASRFPCGGHRNSVCCG